MSNSIFWSTSLSTAGRMRSIDCYNSFNYLRFVIIVISSEYTSEYCKICIHFDFRALELFFLVNTTWSICLVYNAITLAILKRSPFNLFHFTYKRLFRHTLVQRNYMYCGIIFIRAGQCSWVAKTSLFVGT